MMFEPIADYLESELRLKQGKSLFINQMPAEVPLGVLLKDGFSGTTIDGEIPNLRRGNFQIAVRGRDYKTVKDTMNQIMIAMTMLEKPFDGFVMKSCRPTNEPVSFMLSIGNNYEMSVNFYAIYGIVAQ